MKDLIIDRFIDIVRSRYPDASDLKAFLRNLLSLDQSSIYRRLSKRTDFSIEEIVKIASALEISLDALVNVVNKELIFKGRFVDYNNFSKDDLKYLRLSTDAIKRFQNLSNSEYIEVAMTLPRTIIVKFPILSQYKLLAWSYYYDYQNRTKSFSEMRLPESIVETLTEMSEEIKKLKTTTYIWDPNIFENSVRRVKYFHSIHLINDDDKEIIKDTYLKVLKYIYELASNGVWSETSNQVKLYIAHTNLDTNFSYMSSDEHKICALHIFSYNRVHSMDPGILKDVYEWIQLYKKSSFLISKTDEKSRIDFFEKQLEIVNSL